MIQQLHKRKATSNGGGFTIIEVMIVLAIAGLIMLIVFLAVPALQRSARNTQRKNDVAAVLAAINDYENNNGGAVPPSGSFSMSGNTLTISGGATTASATAKLGYYTAVTLNTAWTAPAASATDTLAVNEASQCTSATAGAAGSTRQVAAIYGIETGSAAYAWQCQGS